MTALEALKSYARLNWHDDGLMLASIGEVPMAELSKLRGEAREIVARLPGSDVRNPEHVTYWTGPHGLIRQWSLVNRENRTDATASDYETGKPFVVPQAECLRMFAGEHEGLVNMRLNLMGPDSGLSLHREATAIMIDGRPRLKVRFHLPLLTAGSPCRLGNGLYEMKPGQVYLFNNGAAHSSWNAGSGAEARVHLVWDCLVTRGMLSFLPDPQPVNPSLEVMPEEYPHEKCGVDEEALNRELECA